MLKSSVSNAERPARRRIVLALALVISVPVVLVLAVALANLYDPPLDPGVQAAIDWNPPAVPDAENSYFDHLGFWVPPPADPHREGMAIVAENNARILQRAREPRDYAALARAVTTDIESPSGRKTLAWRGGSPASLCAARRGDCLADYARNRARIRGLAANNPVALARYRALYRYPHFQERLIERVNLGWSPSPSFGGTARAVVLGEIGLKALDGRGEAAVRDLGRDITYWRRVLADAHTLLPKIIAVPYLDRDYVLLSEIAARYRDDGRVVALAQTLLAPLSAEERDWRGPVTDEIQRLADMFLHVPSQDLGIGELDPGLSWIPSRLAYKPNATANLMCAYWNSVLSVAAEPAGRFRVAARQWRETLQETGAVPRLGLLYNPVGKVFVSLLVPPPDYVRYIAAQHNLDGRMRLVRLQLGLYRRHVGAAGIESYLKESPAALRDPYTGEPMRWDAALRELWFNGIDSGGKDNDFEPDRRITVRL
jgi:hypothetical protein